MLLTLACSGKPIAVSVVPEPAKALTCSTTQFTATVTGTSDTAVEWSSSPGSIDAQGKYRSPPVTPSPASAKVTAASHADPTMSASADVTLATAFPGAAAAVTGTGGFNNVAGATGVYPHATASSGNRLYAAWAENPPGLAQVRLKIGRSDDGGATWKAPVVAIQADLPGGAGAGWLECPAIAVDASSADVVYAVAHISTDNSLYTSTASLDSGATLAFAVSTDGGATFSTKVLHVGTGDICPDVASPSANTVVVASPGWSSCTGGQRDVFVWSDANRGAAFAGGATAANEYFAAGYTSSLDHLAGAGCGPSHVSIESNGGTDLSGQASEAPRLTVDNAGGLCVSYIGDPDSASGSTVPRAHVQCSTDAGKTFSAGTSFGGALALSSAIAPLGPNGAGALIWASTDSSNTFYINTTTDRWQTPVNSFQRIPTYVPLAGASGPPINPTALYDSSGVLWLAYRTGDGLRIVVDKSCDGGAAWSGPALVNGPEPSPVELRWPSLAPTSSAAPRVTAWAAGQISSYALAP
ncbi:MAG: hypothetical protein ABR567_14135 [Myxococcales bacterium]|nr:glycoside hydrolase [Myxococcales bacterium]